jgi:hypothetical protein
MDVGAMRSPEVHYTQSGDVHVAYQTFGSGPIGWFSCPAGFLKDLTEIHH